MTANALHPATLISTLLPPQKSVCSCLVCLFLKMKVNLFIRLYDYIYYFAVFPVRNKESCSKIISRYFTLVTRGNHALWFKVLIEH